MLLISTATLAWTVVGVASAVIATSIARDLRR